MLLSLQSDEESFSPSWGAGGRPVQQTKAECGRNLGSGAGSNSSCSSPRPLYLLTHSEVDEEPESFLTSLCAHSAFTCRAYRTCGPPELSPPPALKLPSAGSAQWNNKPTSNITSVKDVLTNTHILGTAGASSPIHQLNPTDRPPITLHSLTSPPPPPSLQKLNLDR